MKIRWDQSIAKSADSTLASTYYLTKNKSRLIIGEVGYAQKLKWTGKNSQSSVNSRSNQESRSHRSKIPSLVTCLNSQRNVRGARNDWRRRRRRRRREKRGRKRVGRIGWVMDGSRGRYPGHIHPTQSTQSSTVLFNHHAQMVEVTSGTPGKASKCPPFGDAELSAFLPAIRSSECVHFLRR